MKDRNLSWANLGNLVCGITEFRRIQNPGREATQKKISGLKKKQKKTFDTEIAALKAPRLITTPALPPKSEVTVA